MKKESVDYTEALELKELGFDEPCFYQYVRDFDNDGELIPIISETNHPILRDNNQVSLCSGGDCFAAPLKQQAFRWFREKCLLEGTIEQADDFYWYKFSVYFYGKENKQLLSKGLEFKTYEEAELACLKKLIEIVK